MSHAERDDGTLVRVRYSSRDLLALRTGWRINMEVARPPDLRMRRDSKNYLKRLGIYRPQFQQFRLEMKEPEGRFQYSSAMCNRVFKYHHFKNGGTWAQLKKMGQWSWTTTRRYPLKMHVGKHVYVLHGNTKFVRVNRPCSKKRPKRRYFVEVTDREVLKTGIGPVYIPPGKRDEAVARTGLFLNKQIDANMIRAKMSHNGDISVLGGPVLPLRHHKKYWYFLRKRGHFTLSEHHPYGDEYLIFDAP